MKLTHFRLSRRHFFVTRKFGISWHNLNFHKFYCSIFKYTSRDYFSFQKIVSAWKKYWFVLEERLLLYYRSQIEYINLSPCRGSLNLGLVTTVRPGSSSGPCIIHVITRTQVVQLVSINKINIRRRKLHGN